jgi:hypothetical protein
VRWDAGAPECVGMRTRTDSNRRGQGGGFGKTRNRGGVSRKVADQDQFGKVWFERLEGMYMDVTEFIPYFYHLN